MTRKTVKKIFSAALNAVLWATLIFAVLLMLLAVFQNLSGSRRSLFGVGLYQIVSGSMEPEINVGDVVVAKNCTIDSLSVGDNVVFIYGDKLVTHKVQQVGDGFIVTKGVANTATERVAASDIVARQLFVLPKLGYVLDFLRSGFGFILIIALPLGGIIVWQSVTLAKRLKEYREKEKTDAAAQAAEQSEKLQKEIQALKSVLAQRGSGSDMPTGGNDNLCERKQPPQVHTADETAKADEAEPASANKDREPSRKIGAQAKTQSTVTGQTAQAKTDNSAGKRAKQSKTTVSADRQTAQAKTVAKRENEDATLVARSGAQTADATAQSFADKDKEQALKNKEAKTQSGEQETGVNGAVSPTAEGKTGKIAKSEDKDKR